MPGPERERQAGAPAGCRLDLPGHCQSLVVGAGVIGLGVACELAHAGQQVLVLDSDELGASSPAAGGMLGPTSEADLEDEVLIGFALDSLRRYPDFVAALERATGDTCELSTEGTVWVARDHDDARQMQHLYEMQQAIGLRSEWFDAKSLLSVEPRLCDRVTGGLRVDDDLHVNPRALLRCLRAALVSDGGRVVQGCCVEGLTRGEGALRVEGRTSSGDGWHLRCDRAVLAAGAWTGRLWPALARLGMRPVKGQLLRLAGEPLLSRVVRTPDSYLIPQPGGRLTVGGTMEEMGFDANPTAGRVHDMLRHAWRVLPGIYDLAVEELTVGFRPTLRDHLPAIGPTEVDDLFVATGHFRNGILLAPATAHYLAGCITSGRVAPQLEPFSPTRSAAGEEVTACPRSRS